MGKKRKQRRVKEKQKEVRKTIRKRERGGPEGDQRQEKCKKMNSIGGNDGVGGKSKRQEG